LKAVTISLSKKEATSIYLCLFIEILELGLLKRLIKRQDSQTNSM